MKLETGLYMPPAIRLDLTEAELEQRYLVPRSEGSPLVVKGSTIQLAPSVAVRNAASRFEATSPSV